ncbi:MAG: RloB family protein [Microthrixaceae bacterium]
MIVCEGAKTEPQYFKGFRLPSVRVEGAGKNTRSLVEEAIRIKAETASLAITTGCVFDRDSFPAQTFNAALQMARSAGFEVAYSNEAFELWYLLHFSYSDTGSRAPPLRREADQVPRSPLREERSQRSTRPCSRSRSRPSSTPGSSSPATPAHNPEKDNPSTRVHELVELLRAAQQGSPD